MQRAADSTRAAIAIAIAGNIVALAASGSALHVVLTRPLVPPGSSYR